MRNEVGELIDDKYAGDLQDIFVLLLLGTETPGTFIDIGCRDPLCHSNTALLDKYGWKGVAVDLVDYSEAWKIRKNSRFIHSDALFVPYKDILENSGIETESPKLVDYLSIDLDGRSIAYHCLKQIIDTGYEFKVLTIEHDAYSGNELSDMIPQRDLLLSKGYVLVKHDNTIEDFWINPKYVSKEKYERFIYTNSSIQWADDSKHFWEHLISIKQDFFHLYK
jgi:hypothetical protein